MDIFDPDHLFLSSVPVWRPCCEGCVVDWECRYLNPTHNSLNPLAWHGEVLIAVLRSEIT